ncbi:MAG: hypothetical protein H7A31_03935 [Thermotogae bacterium]|nr:hypothetical protein [Thermotogota bacterium]MCP5465828.1 hypothetical protein [Thermotogota bacterium]
MRKMFSVIIFLGIVLTSFSAGELYNESFFQTDIREALSTVSFDSGVTIIADPNVIGYVTMDIYDKTLEEIIDMILMPFGYSWKKIDDYILVGVPDPSSGTSIHLNDTYVMKTRHITPRALYELLPKYFQKFVSYSTSEDSMVVINAPPKIAGTIANTIRKIDIGKAQILVEIKVVQIDTFKFKEWSLKNLQITSPYVSANNPFDNQNQHVSIDENNLELFYKMSSTDIAFMLEKAISEGEAKVVSNSKINVLSGDEGSLAGKLSDYITTSTDGKTSEKYTGFTITLTPFLMTGKKIRVDANIELNDIRSIDPSKDSVISNNLKSNIVLNLDEESSVAAFNYSTTSKSEIGVPIFSKIPGIGSLFKTVKEKEIEQQLIFLVTCHASGGEIQ